MRKKYRRIDGDIKPILGQLQQGETPGDRVQGTGYTVYKARIPNSDAQRGKSGGNRIIYYIKRTEYVILAYIYAKSEQDDINLDELRRIIDEINLD